MKPNLKQIRYDVERLRKASDRLDELHAAYCDALEKIKIAEMGLKIISAWAADGKNAHRIESYAMDIVRLIK